MTEGSDIKDAELIERARFDVSRFTPIFERHFSTIYRFTARRIGPELAKDVASETFVVALTRLESFNSRHDSALPWLYGIARNLIRNHQRSERRKLQFMSRLRAQQSIEEDTGDSEDAVSNDAVTGAIEQALNSLSPSKREALLLFAWDDLPQAEVARIQGVPAATVRSRISRARKEVREHLARSGQYWDESSDFVKLEEPTDRHGG